MANQAVLFVATEAVTVLLNAALYQAVASQLPLTLTTAVLARIVTTNLVFLLWSYPVWKRVFKPGIGGALPAAPTRRRGRVPAARSRPSSALAHAAMDPDGSMW